MKSLFSEIMKKILQFAFQKYILSVKSYRCWRKFWSCQQFSQFFFPPFFFFALHFTTLQDSFTHHEPSQPRVPIPWINHFTTCRWETWFASCVWSNPQKNYEYKLKLFLYPENPISPMLTQMRWLNVSYTIWLSTFQ